MPRRIRDTRKPAPSHMMRMADEDGTFIEFTPEGGGTFTGTVAEINALLTALGYHEIAVRRNMMTNLAYIEAKNTPLHMSPSAETYWSM